RLIPVLSMRNIARSKLLFFWSISTANGVTAEIEMDQLQLGNFPISFSCKNAACDLVNNGNFRWSARAPSAVSEINSKIRWPLDPSFPWYRKSASFAAGTVNNRAPDQEGTISAY